LSAEVHLSNVFEIGRTGASATGALLSLGGTLGRIGTPNSPYLSTSIGYSYVNIGDSGEMRNSEEEDQCFIFAPCFGRPKFRVGGHAKGFGFRVATGLAVSDHLRLELGYLSLGGKANGQSAGAKISMDTIRLGLHIQLR